MPLFTRTILDQDTVAAIVQKWWGATIEKVIKSSQNTTYLASIDGVNVIVRATPDEGGAAKQRFEDEMAVIRFCKDNGLEVCTPVQAKIEGDSLWVVNKQDISVSVFTFSRGVELPFVEWKWMKDEAVVRAWGRWLGLFHNVSRKLAQEQPELVSRMRCWDELHEGVAKQIAIAEQDRAIESDPAQYGVLHCDLNCSNWFWVAEDQTLSVFDWDQVSTGWYMMDVAQAAHGVAMIQSMGMPVSGTPVECVNYAEFEGWLLAGYDEVADVKVDRAVLDRMLKLREEFYKTFCIQAKQEGVPDDMPGMKAFIEWVASYYD